MDNDKWRGNVEPGIKDHMESLIGNVYRYKNSYKKSKNPSAAQLWCALAIMSKQIFELNLKIKLLERALKDSNPGGSRIKDVPDKKQRENLMKIASNPEKKS